MAAAGRSADKMDAVQAMYEEARKRGYVSPLPHVLRVALPNRKEVSGTGEWSLRFRNLMAELPGWAEPQERLLATGGLDALARALDKYRGPVLAPNLSRVFRAFAELPLEAVRVVFVGQDPYPTADRSKRTLDAINAMPHPQVEEILGEGYENWDMVQGTPWPDGLVRDGGRPRVRLGAVPYALGKSFGYPSVCTEMPASYRNLRLGAQTCYPRQQLRMDNELNRWTEQGVLMLNACPMLYGNGASGKNPNIWTAWTSEVLGCIARRNPYCVFVLLGNSAKAYKKDVVSARSEACIIETGHPSSRSSSKGDFLNSGLFSRINDFFAAVAEKRGCDPVNRANAAVAPIVW